MVAPAAIVALCASDGLSVDNHSFYTDPASDPVSCTWFFVGLDDQQNLGRCHQSCWVLLLVRTMAFLLMRLRISFAWTWFHQHGRYPRALSRVRSGFFSSLDRVRSLKTPQTIRSLIKLSVRVPNSHDFAFFLRSVAYWSIVSPGC